jgi:hypothetical protein
VNKGLMEFSADGKFEGYMGASSVRFKWSDYIWKLISTNAQTSQMESFVPTEYNNVAVDPDGFLYVTNSVFSEEELQDGSAYPVRRLNLKGTDILNYYLMGNYDWVTKAQAGLWMSPCLTAISYTFWTRSTAGSLLTIPWEICSMPLGATATA